MLGIPPVSAVDVLTGPQGEGRFLILLVAMFQMVILLSIALLRFLGRRQYRHHATSLFIAVLLTLLMPQLIDVIITSSSRFQLFSITYLGCVLFLYLPGMYRAVLLYSAIVGAAMIPLLIYEPLPMTTVVPTLTAISLLGIIRQRQREKNIDTVLELRRRKIRLQVQTRLYEQALMAVEESETRYKTVMESMAEGVVVLSSDGIMVACNEAATTILGRSREQIIGSDIEGLQLRLIQEDGRPYPRDLLPALFVQQQGQPVDNVVVGIERESGEKNWLRVNARPLIRRGETKPYGATVTFADTTELKLHADLIRYQAFHDSLTGLANRALLEQSLQLELAHAKREKTLLAVLFIDLDRFKAVNDSLGHAAGDDLLMEVANRLQSALRQSDTLARTGGDEFIAVRPRLQLAADALTVADKILSVLERPAEIAGRQVQISASIGVAVYPHDGETGDALLQHADTAMYSVKKSGRKGNDVEARSKDRSYLLDNG